MALKHQIKTALPSPARRVVEYRLDQLRQVRDGLRWRQHFAPDHPYEKFVKSAREYSMARSQNANRPVHDSTRYLMLQMVLDLVGRCDSGDYAEVGTYRGMVAKIVWERRAGGADFFCFDTFEGFADTDLDAEGNTRQTLGLSHRFKDTSLLHVENYITGGGSSSRLKFRVGFFPETFEGLEERTFRFVHLDCDLYQPIKAGLETFWPRLVEGGAVLVHDYFSSRYVRAREAVDEFFLPRGIIPMPMQDRDGTAVVFKQRGMM